MLAALNRWPNASVTGGRGSRLGPHPGGEHGLPREGCAMTQFAGSRPGALGARAVDAGPARLRLTSQLREWLADAWRRLAGARGLPADVRTELAFERGERVLLARHDPDGDYALVASERAVYHRSEADGWSRLGWEQISRISWDAAAGQLHIVSLGGVGGVGGVGGPACSRTVVPLRDRGRLPELAQERTTHTKVGRWHLQLVGDRSVLVEVRRRPGTGELVWAVISPSDGFNSLGADATADIARAIGGLGERLGLCDPPSGEPERP